MKLRSLLLLCAVTLVSACNNDTESPVPVPASHAMAPVTQNKHGQRIAPPPQRFEVTLQYTFWDELAYGDKRGVYLITDAKTGKEILGVSGIGVVDLGFYTVTQRTGKLTSSKRVEVEE